MAKGQNFPAFPYLAQTQRGALSTAKLSTRKPLSGQFCPAHQSHTRITCLLHLV